MADSECSASLSGNVKLEVWQDYKLYNFPSYSVLVLKPDVDRIVYYRFVIKNFHQMQKPYDYHLS